MALCQNYFSSWLLHHISTFLHISPDLSSCLSICLNMSLYFAQYVFFSLYPNCVCMSTKNPTPSHEKDSQGFMSSTKAKGFKLGSLELCLPPFFFCLCVLMGIVVPSLYCCSLIVIVIIHEEHELLITLFSLPSIFFSFVFANVCFVFLQKGDDCHHMSRHLCHVNEDCCPITLLL